MSEGIWCFSTPTRDVAEAHPDNHFAWMLNGMALYAAVSAVYPLFTGMRLGGKKASFETFPHAVACALAKEVISAKRKSSIRRGLLKQCNIDTTELRNIDYVDAALCALTGVRLLDGKSNKYGDLEEGFIVVPQCAATHYLMKGK
jgi:hypothetical protein